MEVGREGRRRVLVRPSLPQRVECVLNPPSSLPPLHVLHRSSAEIQLQRLLKRDGFSKKDATDRIVAQLPMAEKLQCADVVIDNSCTQQELEHQGEQLVQRLVGEAGWTWRLSWLFPPFGIASALWTLGWRALRRSQKARARRR